MCFILRLYYPLSIIQFCTLECMIHELKLNHITACYKVFVHVTESPDYEIISHCYACGCYGYH